MFKREHYCDEIRKGSKGSTKSHRSKKSGSNNSISTPSEISHYGKLNSYKVNYKDFSSLPLVEYKVLKSMGENPRILKSNKTLRNKPAKKNREGQYLKAKR